MDLVIGFVGMTHLGVVSSAAAAAVGAEVVALDERAALVEDLVTGRLPIVEPGLDELLGGGRDRISYTADAAALDRCDIVYVSVDVPTDGEGTSDLGPVLGALELAQAAAHADATIVVLSQVPPGFIRPLAAADARIRYQVETLVFGRAVERAMRPERFIVGVSDPAAGLTPAHERFLLAFGCPVLTMRFESAELTKIAINAFLASTLTTTNTIAGICERVGADWSEIAPALRLDARIGPAAYLDPGLGLSGGNIERDLATIDVLGARTGAPTPLVEAIARDSDHRRGWLVRHLAPALGPDAVVAVLGMAYKAGTASVKGSPGVALVAALAPLAVRWHDPVVPTVDVPAERADDIAAAVEGADAVVLATPWDDYRRIEPATLASAMQGRLVVDPYGLLDHDACVRAALDHHVLGVGRS